MQFRTVGWNRRRRGAPWALCAKPRYLDPRACGPHGVCLWLAFHIFSPPAWKPFIYFVLIFLIFVSQNFASVLFSSFFYQGALSLDERMVSGDSYQTFSIEVDNHEGEGRSPSPPKWSWSTSSAESQERWSDDGDWSTMEEIMVGMRESPRKKAKQGKKKRVQKQTF